MALDDCIVTREDDLGFSPIGLRDMRLALENRASLTEYGDVAGLVETGRLRIPKGGIGGTGLLSGAGCIEGGLLFTLVV